MMLSNYENFLSNIKESLDSNIDITWIDKENKYTGLFSINNNIYQLDFNLVGDSWSYKFYYVSYKNQSFELDVKMTNFKYESFKVLATAKKGLSFFIKEKNPNAVVFFASNESKRQHIYQQILLTNIDKFPEYLYRIDTMLDNQIYVLYKKDLSDSAYTFSNIENIIETYINGG
jgi:hypothetical protein